MQKVRTTLFRCLAVIVIGLLAWSSLLFPADGGLLATSGRSAVAAEEAPGSSPGLEADSSGEEIALPINEVPDTYHTLNSSADAAPVLKPLTTAAPKSTPPKVPTGLKVVAVGDGRLDLSWNYNSENNMKAYRLAYKPAGGEYKSVLTTVNSCSLTGLTNGVSYTLKVKAINTLDEESSYCSFVYATPKSTPPKVPTGLKVVSIGDGRLDVTWNFNTESDIKNYRLAYKPAGGDYKSVFTTDNKYTLTGLSNGKQYTLKVKAFNTAGEESSYCSFVYATPQSSTVPAVEVQTLAAGTKYATPLYIIRSNQPGPVVMVVGGVHGNEAAGYTAARRIADYKISRGTLLVIPEANKLAIQAKRRAAPGENDLNRDFPQSSSQTPKSVLARAIYNAVKEHKVDWLIDLHEGYEYYKNPNASSVGQTLIYYPTTGTQSMAQNIVKDLNKGISGSYYQFTLLRYPVKGSLARAAGEYLGVRSMIFETCDNPALATRVGYQTQAVDYLLNSLNMR